jgi:hypothetical protein
MGPASMPKEGRHTFASTEERQMRWVSSQLARSRPAQAGPTCPYSALPARLGFGSDKCVGPACVETRAMCYGVFYFVFKAADIGGRTKSRGPLHCFLPLPSRSGFCFTAPTAARLALAPLDAFPPTSSSRFFTALNEVSSTFFFLLYSYQ